MGAEEVFREIADVHARLLEAAELFRARGRHEAAGVLFSSAAGMRDDMRTLGSYFAALAPHALDGDTLKDVARRARDAGDAEAAAALDRIAAMALRIPGAALPDPGESA